MPNAPTQDAKGEPGYRSRKKHYSSAVPRQKFPHNRRKSSESDAAQRRSERIERGGLPSAQRRCDSRLSFFLALMFFHKRSAGRRRQGQSAQQE
jgi:hypothetical protein